jgi:hypothetical protein
MSALFEDKESPHLIGGKPFPSSRSQQEFRPGCERKCTTLLHPESTFSNRALICRAPGFRQKE